MADRALVAPLDADSMPVRDVDGPTADVAYKTTGASLKSNPNRRLLAFKGSPDKKGLERIIYSPNDSHK